MEDRILFKDKTNTTDTRSVMTRKSKNRRVDGRNRREPVPSTPTELDTPSSTFPARSIAIFDTCALMHNPGILETTIKSNVAAVVPCAVKPELRRHASTGKGEIGLTANGKIFREKIQQKATKVLHSIDMFENNPLLFMEDVKVMKEKMTGIDMSNPDDKILKCALRVHQHMSHQKRTVWLVTEDDGLREKAEDAGRRLKATASRASLVAIKAQMFRDGLRSGARGARMMNADDLEKLRICLTQQCAGATELALTPECRLIDKKEEKALKQQAKAKTKKLLLTIDCIFFRSVGGDEKVLIDKFLGLKVHESLAALDDVARHVFDKVVWRPERGPKCFRICRAQIVEEEKQTGNVSIFRDALVRAAQNEKSLVLACRDQLAKLENYSPTEHFLRRMRRIVQFIAQLYLHKIVRANFIISYVADLLKSVKPENRKRGPLDEEVIECAVLLLETIQQEENGARANSAELQKAHPIERAFQALEQATPFVSSRIKLMIEGLVKLRKNRWVPRKKEAEKEQNADQQPGRNQSRAVHAGGRPRWQILRRVAMPSQSDRAQDGSLLSGI